MRLLLDTCSLLWFLTNDPKLSTGAKIALRTPTHERWLSPISLMEIAIKVRIGKLPLPAPFAAMFPLQLTLNQIQLIPLAVNHITPLATLPMHHKDPFDRLIAATAVVEALTVVSSDAAFDLYGLTRLW